MCMVKIYNSTYSRIMWTLSFIKGDMIILFKDNIACIAQITWCYIKGDRTKHISPKFVYTDELQKSNEIDHFSCLVIRQPLKNLKDVIYPFKNASKFS